MKERLTIENFRRLLLIKLRHINKIKLMDFIINENRYIKRTKKKLKIKKLKNDSPGQDKSPNKETNGNSLEK